MSLHIIRAGLQTTLQGEARKGVRHFGVPAAGPADPLSMTLANRLVGREAFSTAIEITLTEFRVQFSQPMAFAVTGGEADIHLNRMSVPAHETQFAEAGDELAIGAIKTGCRVYLAVSGSILADEFLGSTSTYMPGGFGGHSGRALRDGDTLEVASVSWPERTSTPMKFRPLFNNRVILQIVEGPDYKLIANEDAFLRSDFQVTQRSSRMGVQLKGCILDLKEHELLKSAATFPGTIQCPPDGMPFVLLPDCQSTGGYPHLYQIARSDRFQLGQLRPGTEIRFVKRTPDYAEESYRTRFHAYKEWLINPVI